MSSHSWWELTYIRYALIYYFSTSHKIFLKSDTYWTNGFTHKVQTMVFAINVVKIRLKKWTNNNSGNSLLKNYFTSALNLVLQNTKQNCKNHVCIVLVLQKIQYNFSILFLFIASLVLKNKKWTTSNKNHSFVISSYRYGIIHFLKCTLYGNN